MAVIHVPGLFMPYRDARNTINGPCGRKTQYVIIAGVYREVNAIQAHHICRITASPQATGIIYINDYAIGLGEIAAFMILADNYISKLCAIKSIKVYINRR